MLQIADVILVLEESIERGQRTLLLMSRKVELREEIRNAVVDMKRFESSYEMTSKYISLIAANAVGGSIVADKLAIRKAKSRLERCRMEQLKKFRATQTALIGPSGYRMTSAGGDNIVMHELEQWQADCDGAEERMSETLSLLRRKEKAVVNHCRELKQRSEEKMRSEKDLADRIFDVKEAEEEQSLITEVYYTRSATQSSIGSLLVSAVSGGHPAAVHADQLTGAEDQLSL